MRSIKAKTSLAVVAGGLVLVVLLFLLVIPRINVPAPQRDTYQIAPGGVSRAIVQHKSPRSRGRPGRSMLPRLPHHLEFESTGGTVDVYVVRYPSGSVRDQVGAMQRVTDRLASGRPPRDVVARGTGARGRLDLNSWPYGTAKYLVLVRSKGLSEVTLVTHYGP